MVILFDNLGHRYLSETRIAVCPILGPVFVLWFSADHSLSAGDSVSGGGVVTSTTSVGGESPEAFHA